MDIKCRIADLKPDAIVIVATIRALKMHGGVIKTELSKPDCKALEKGFENLKAHLENIAKFKVPAVIAVNRFVTDTEEEINLLKALCEQNGTKAVLCEGWGKGSEGTISLAKHRESSFL